MPHLELSDDHLLATLFLEPGETTDPEEVRGLLRALGIKYGLKADVLETLGERIGLAVLVVAEGLPARDSQDGYVEYAFRSDHRDLSPVIGEDGRADFRNLGLVASVQPGQVLARRIPPTAGQEGRTVTGFPIRAEAGRDVRLRAGRGAEVSADGLTVVATIAGNPHQEGAVVLVRQEYVVPGHVSLATGNIEFDGDLVVSGDVQMQMQVKATGNITIHGVVEGATVVSGGRIDARRGVRHKATLTAANEVVAQYMEHSTLRCGGSLDLAEHLIHSQVEVAGSIRIGGAIVGGVTRLGERLEAAVLGARLGTPTLIVAVPSALVDKEMQALAEERAAIQANLLRIAPRLREAHEALKNPLTPSPDLAVFRKVLELSAQLTERNAVLAEQERTLQLEAQRTRPSLLVRETLHPGVSLRLGAACRHFQETFSSATLYEALGAVCLVPLTM